MACFPSESLGSLPLRSWKFWSTLMCAQLVLMVDSTHAGRKLQQQASHRRQLQPFRDDTNNPRHAPPVQSFLVSDGSWVDCIPIEGQISAHHPALSDHIIQMRPSHHRRSTGQARSSELHPQLFAREHGGCPEGSIPVQRLDPNRSLLKKKSQSPARPEANETWTTWPETHEYAVTGLPESPHAYTGAFSIFSVNRPVLGNPKRDFSLSQVWVVDGHWNDSTLSTIEVGWQTYPYMHHFDKKLAPHLFVFWTTDAYNETGCYNLDCPGFVQYSNKWVIGGAMPFYTTLAENAQTESELGVEVVFDKVYMVWWLLLNDDPVGYWPSSIYEGGRLGWSANTVEWGGEIIYYKDANPVNHSKTTMGSGAFPSAGYPVAAYHRNISYADLRSVLTGDFYNPTPAILKNQTYVNDPLCYDLAVQKDNFTNWGSYFFFGGSGGNNPGCVGRKRL